MYFASSIESNPWSDGKMEYWNNGIKKQKNQFFTQTIISNSSFQYSPSADRQATLQYSRVFTLSSIPCEINPFDFPV